MKKKTINFYREILQLYKLFGIDSILSEFPVNNFNIKNIKNDVISSKNKKEELILVDSEEKIISSWKKAYNASSLEELRQQLESFDSCSLKFSAKNTCFSDGTPGSMLMLIGEAPGEEEDIQGVPFVGKSGILLNSILSSIGLSRNKVYITNIVPWRPLKNRNPNEREIKLCHPFLDRQIELVNPKILITLGGFSTRSLTGSKEGILKIRGTWNIYRTKRGIKIPLMPTLHPSYLLRTPSKKKLVWEDFLLIKEKLDFIKFQL